MEEHQKRSDLQGLHVQFVLSLHLADERREPRSPEDTDGFMQPNPSKSCSKLLLFKSLTRLFGHTVGNVVFELKMNVDRMRL